VLSVTASIANDDPDENPYTFTIRGTGVLDSEPTTQGTGLVFSGVTNNLMTVSWQSGDGTNRILVARLGSSVSGAPVDGSDYTDNAAFGSGDTIAAGEFLVFNGSGTNVTVTALLPGTTYCFALFEYNGIDSGANYLTNAPLAGCQATLTFPPVITEGESIGVTMSENGNPTPFSLTLNATDSDLAYGDTLTWSIRHAPEHGTATASGTGTSVSVGYTPTVYYMGADSFEVQVTDSFGNYDTITVNVTITAVNPAGKTIFIME